MTNQEAMDYIEQECRMCKSYSNADNECYALNEACFLSKQLAIEALKVNISAKWISVKDRLPESTGEYVLVLASGKPSENVTLVQAYELAEFDANDGWILEMYPEWENPTVTHWMPLPSTEGLSSES